MMGRKESNILRFCRFKPFWMRKNWFRESNAEKRTGLFCDSIDFNPSKVERKTILDENFRGSLNTE
jgi:hypothetical protein